MKVLQGNFGPTTISEDTTIQGMIIGAVEIMPRVRAVIQGTVTGDIHVGEDAFLTVQGVFNGRIDGPGRVVTGGIINGEIVGEFTMTDADGNVIG